ncbi:4-hydroxyphenylacetate 3-hydroxylase family protein [Agromyces archimandritae]|uniref:4-hydroxyphenylacetate 3-hydroxylase n=1 Tax=Agromyces archimandritae TaxID=2781962 RepID=A0A975FLN2_9MICO|nr:4-hydroxyphenylacetate 3-hydroxylase N-terminal domain-containing protein [Agromyces archimandritae]QTX04389.1 4-hydroxyphenylacetate 3-hydroxylase [Agromyces archimandritae]
MTDTYAKTQFEQVLLTSGLGALTGERYKESLRDGREVWLNGERIEDVTVHPAFKGTVDRLAELYDLQHSEGLRDVMTYVDEDSGIRLSKSYLLPRTLDELKEKYANSHAWMQNTWGQLGRSPDYMANVVVGLYDFRDELEGNREGFGQNAVDYWKHCAYNDLALTHALGDPQIDRSKSVLDDPDQGLRIIEEREDGIVVRGAKQLATLAPLSNEVLSYLSASFAVREAEEFVLWFALPMNTPGLKILCREPLGDHEWGHGHPFARQYDEQDSMLFFDDVFIPWQRVFLMHDGPLALTGLRRITPWAGYSSHIRFEQRMKTYLGVASLVADSIGVSGFRNIQEQLGEMTSVVEIARFLTLATEAQHTTTSGGLVAPVSSPAVGVYSANISGRMQEILRRIAASGMLMQPSQADLDSEELRPFLEKYMKGADGMGVDEKARIFRLAWDLAGDGFGQRQELYEFLHRGDVTRNLIGLYHRYDKSDLIGRIKTMVSAPLPE